VVSVTGTRGLEFRVSVTKTTSGPHPPFGHLPHFVGKGSTYSGALLAGARARALAEGQLAVLVDIASLEAGVVGGEPFGAADEAVLVGVEALEAAADAGWTVAGGRTAGLGVDAAIAAP
jgi:hypothetical protein